MGIAVVNFEVKKNLFLRGSIQSNILLNITFTIRACCIIRIKSAEVCGWSVLCVFQQQTRKTHTSSGFIQFSNLFMQQPL
jgi:hypothetical protein